MIAMNLGFPSEDKASLETMGAEQLTQLKIEFAHALLKCPDSPFQAALSLFPTDRPTALKISNLWPFDPQVIRHRKAILEESGGEEYLPTKVEFLNKVWDRMDKASDPSDFAKLSNIYADVRGFYPDKNAAQTNINVMGETVKVMQITNMGSDDDWALKAQNHQEKLLGDGS